MDNTIDDVVETEEVDKLIGIKELSTYDKFIKAYIDDKTDDEEFHIVYKESHLGFPVVGDKNALYIDISTNSIYRWSDDRVSYFKLGDDFEKKINEIEVIDGMGKL